MRYSKALLCPENNSYGYATILKLKELQYPRLYYPKRKSIYIGDYIPSSDRDIAGFNTSGRTRTLILSKLEETIRNKQISIHSSRFYEEVKTFTWQGQKAQAKRGFNDDLVISMAIAMWLYDASDEHSKNSKILNNSMLKAMKLTSNLYQSPDPSDSKRKLLDHGITSDEANSRIKEGQKKSNQAKNKGLPDEFLWVLR